MLTACASPRSAELLCRLNTSATCDRQRGASSDARNAVCASTDVQVIANMNESGNSIWRYAMIPWQPAPCGSRRALPKPLLERIARSSLGHDERQFSTTTPVPPSGGDRALFRIGAGRRSEQRGFRSCLSARVIADGFGQGHLAPGAFDLVGIVDPSPLAVGPWPRLPGLTCPRFDTIEGGRATDRCAGRAHRAIEELRKEQCLAALDAGWQSLSWRKPFCLTFDDARSVVEAGDRAGRIVSSCRTSATCRRSTRCISSLPQERSVRPGTAGFYRAGHRDYKIGDRLPPDIPHVYLYRQGVPISTSSATPRLRPKRVAAISYRPPWGDFPGETTVTAILEFERNVRVSYFGAWALPVSDHFWRIDGTKDPCKVSGTDPIGTPRACWSALGSTESPGRGQGRRRAGRPRATSPSRVPIGVCSASLRPRSAPAVQPARAAATICGPSALWTQLSGRQSQVSDEPISWASVTEPVSTSLRETAARVARDLYGA